MAEVSLRRPSNGKINRSCWMRSAKRWCSSTAVLVRLALVLPCSIFMVGFGFIFLAYRYLTSSVTLYSLLAWSRLALSPSATKNSAKRRKVSEGDTMRAAMVDCNERLMNLDNVISDDEIRADVALIYKVS